MKALAQLRSESASEQSRGIWRGIVQFANTDLEASFDDFIEDFLELLARCSHKETEADWKRSEAAKRAFERELQEKLSPEELATVEEAAHRLKLVMAKTVESDERRDEAEQRIKRLLRKKLSAEKLALAMDDIRHALKLGAEMEAEDKPNGELGATGVDGIGGQTQEHLELAQLFFGFKELDLATNKGLTHRQAFKMLARKYHAGFTQMLTWICAPDKNTELAPAAVQLLQKNLRRNVNLVSSPADFDSSSSDYYPVFYWRSDDYYSIMEPICEFIFERIERYHAGDLELYEAVPIRICERSGCGRFLLPKRVSRLYCSSSCRARAFQTREDWAGYMRRYRRTLKDMARPIRRRSQK